MRAVVQRVGQASCVGGGESVSIGKGLVALIGIAVGDTVEDAEVCGSLQSGTHTAHKPRVSLLSYPSIVAVPSSSLARSHTDHRLFQYLIKKILNLKFWASTDEDSARWQQSVTEIGGEILLVSQYDRGPTHLMQ